jgi:hypothetical protein
MPTEIVTTMLSQESEKHLTQLTNLTDGDALVELMEWGGI